MTYEEIMRKTDELSGHIARLDREIDALCRERSALYDLAQEVAEKDYQEKQV